MTDSRDAGVEAARKLLRELNDAMKSPRGDYYQGDIEDPHRALHIVAEAIAAHTEAAVEGQEYLLDEFKIQFGLAQEKLADLTAAVQGWKDMADKEHALAVEFASKNVDLTAQLAARQTWIDEYAKHTEVAIQQRDEAWAEFDDLTARLASMTRTLEGRICELCWGSNWSPVPPSEEHPEGRRCDHCWLTARLAAAITERDAFQAENHRLLVERLTPAVTLPPPVGQE